MHTFFGELTHTHIQNRKVHIANNGLFTLNNAKHDILPSVEVAAMRGNLMCPSCSTYHSARVSSSDDANTIVDCNYCLVMSSPERMWTAIPRCRDLNKVKFFIHTKDTDAVFNRDV